MGAKTSCSQKWLDLWGIRPALAEMNGEDFETAMMVPVQLVQGCER